MSDYVAKICICIHEDDKEAGNQLALLFGLAAADVNTFKAPNFTKGGENYLCTAPLVKQTFINRMGGGDLSYPDHLLDEQGSETVEIDIASAGALLATMDLEGQAEPGKLTARIIDKSDDAIAAFSSMGLTLLGA